MSDATLSPYHVQNEQIFQEYVQSQVGDSTLTSDVPLQHPEVAVYLRVSTGDQTVESQMMKLRPFLIAEGYDVAECSLYVDEGVSAKSYPNFTDRPAGSELMQDVKDGKISKIYGYAVNRFFRRVAQGASWLDEMADKHPLIVTGKQQVGQ